MTVITRCFLIILCLHITAAIVAAQDEFDKFKEEFQQKVTTNLGNEPVQTWDTLSLYTSKKLAGSALAAKFNQSRVTVEANVPNQSFSPPPVELKFPKIIKSCAPKCPSCCDCGLFKPGCCLCHVGRAACIAAEAPLIASCFAAKTLLDAAAGAHLGDISFTGVQAQAKLNPTTLSLSVDEALSNATVRSTSGSLNAEVEVEGVAQVRLETLVGLFTACFPSQNVDVKRTRVNVSTSDPLSLDNKLAPATTEDGVNMQMTLQKANMRLRFDVSPFLNVIKDNPELLVTCPLPAGVLTAVGVGDQIFDFNKSFELPTKDVPVTIGLVTITKPGKTEKIKLNPKIGTLSLGVAEAPGQ